MSEHKLTITGTNLDGGWYYGRCSCGYKLGAYQSRSEVTESWKIEHVRK